MNCLRKYTLKIKVTFNFVRIKSVANSFETNTRNVIVNNAVIVNK